MKCKADEKIIIAGNEYDPCEYVEIAEYRNVTVKVLKCKRCGHIEIEWQRQNNTEAINYE